MIIICVLRAFSVPSAVITSAGFREKTQKTCTQMKCASATFAPTNLALHGQFSPAGTLTALPLRKGDRTTHKIKVDKALRTMTGFYVIQKKFVLSRSGGLLRRRSLPCERGCPLSHTGPRSRRSPPLHEPPEGGTTNRNRISQLFSICRLFTICIADHKLCKGDFPFVLSTCLNGQFLYEAFQRIV